MFFAVFLLTLGYGVSFPLLAIRLEQSGVGAARIGLNAAMPALGWLLVMPLLPRLHHHFSTKQLLLAFLTISLLGLTSLAASHRLDVWLSGRLAFGGGIGMLFRVLEYWLNATAPTAIRGRIIGIYAFCFLLGIAVGSLLQPQFGTVGVTAFAAVGLPMMVGGAVLAALSIDRILTNQDSAPISTRTAATVAPLAVAAVICYGLYEDVPAYLLSVYSLRVGMGTDIAAYTLTAYAFGNLIGAVPLGILSDKLGRAPVLSGCAAVGMMCALVLPMSASTSQTYLLIIALWGACAGALYAVGLAMVGDHFSGQALISANALFGTVYAAAALVGPLINGAAMQLWDPHGLLLSCVVIFAAYLPVAAFVARRNQGLDTSQWEQSG
ncbi:MFS transporter [uncultured Shimia sp.]|uniref:MFS transporter n=1 Tax=uncultured Shimia sp. TaxID=573152 RepID=UPI0025E7548A|nr:MFS transporter [uncultured Shimia sp.]